MRLRKIFAILLISVIMLRDIPVFAYTLCPEYLCEQGIKYYQQGRIADAVMELKKALLANPDYEPAKRYMAIIQRQLAVQQGAQAFPQASIEEKLADIYANLDRIYVVLDKIDSKVSPPGGYSAESPLVIQQVTQELKTPELVGVLEKIAASLERLENKMSAPEPGLTQGTVMRPSSETAYSLERVIAALEKMDKKFALQEEIVSLRSKLEEQKGLSQVKASEISSVLDDVLKVIEKIEKRVAMLEGAAEARQKSGKQGPVVISRPAEEVFVPEKPVETVSIPRKEAVIVPEKEPVKGFASAAEKKKVETAGGIPHKEYAPAVIVPRDEPVKKAVVPPPAEKNLALSKSAPPQIINLYENYNGLKFPLEIERDKSIIIKGHTIARFLATEQGIIDVSRSGSDEITVTAKMLGRTYFHVWDDKGRWTFEFQVMPPKVEGLTVAEQMRIQEERAGTFKLTYDVDWSSSESGGRLGTLDRHSYSWTHYYTLRGETPYGEFDSNATVQTDTVETEVTGYSLGITKGRFHNFKDFAFRIFDISPAISNMAYGGTNLRGFQFYSPAFNKTVDYTVFQGRETGGVYGLVSPGLTKKKDSFIEGVDVNFRPKGKFNYGLAAFHGFGGDRPDYVNDYGYDGDIDWKGPAGWTTRYEVGYDTEKMAHLLSGKYAVPKLNFTYELRDINKDYLSITGSGWRTGERGGLFTFGYTPSERWNISNTLDVYQDRLFPASDRDDRWNEDYSVYSNYRINPVTNWSADYVLQNDLGKISQNRYQSLGTGLSTVFDVLSRKVSVYTNYRRSDNRNYSNPSGSSLNNSISNGIRFKLLGELYYYLNKQWGWVEQRYDGSRHRTEALETGVDMNTRIGKGPFYQTSRLIYRDEESGGTTLGTVSGEDYIESYLEIGFRPDPDLDVYCSGRLRHVWPENKDQRIRVDADFTAGLRYVWDTGVRWEAVSIIEGYVFNDLNSDGLRQKDEAPVEGIKIWVGKRNAVTDLFGYYKVANVKGRKTPVNVDVTTLPQGFVLTGPGSQEIALSQSRKIRVDFGIVSRSEIAGIVFHDVNGDGNYNAGDIGIRGVVVTLEDGKKAVTDTGGRYVFGNASPGAHVVTIDLNTIPVVYLPKVALTKSITLFEGVTYNYNIPLKKTQ
ncbi:MAG: SdrD B-like domain-containing protein [Candidatus Omnitrophica bacterium]|nr:SdrD B-like domain-containing protein [Candidatus Omnitrophota bacterium]